MFFSVFKRLRYLYGSPPLDNFVFKLCYRWTTSMLVVFSFVVTCKLLIRDSFVCINKDTWPSSYTTAKCYASTIYTQPAKLIIKEDGSYSTNDDPASQNYRRNQDYYPWVNLLFLVQAFNFYLPHLLWKAYERGYAYRLTAGVQKFFEREENRGLELCYLAKYFLVTQGKHKTYTAAYVFFEACNFAISLAHTQWLVHFFDVTGIPDSLPLVLGTWSDFKNFYFPSEGYCDYLKPGASGDPQRHRALCQLTLNGLYMNMFLFLRAWYVLMTVLCGLVLFYRFALLVPNFRTFAAKLSSPLSERKVLKSVCRKLSYSDWFFLSTLQNLMTDMDFAQMVDKIGLVSQGKELQKEDDARFSMYENATRDFDSTNTTSPL